MGKPLYSCTRNMNYQHLQIFNLGTKAKLSKSIRSAVKYFSFICLLKSSVTVWVWYHLRKGLWFSLISAIAEYLTCIEIAVLVTVHSFSKWRCNQITRQSKHFVVTTIYVSHQHINISMVTLFCQFQQLIKFLRQTQNTYIFITEGTTLSHLHCMSWLITSDWQKCDV